jgi:hypothetical protein
VGLRGWGFLGSVADPDSIRSVDPDPESDPDLDPGGQKLPTKIELINNFIFLNYWIFSFNGFSCRLGVFMEAFR